MARSEAAEDFNAFARDVERRLRFALAGTAPNEVVLDAIQDTLIYAWRHWDRVRKMANPAGYLYRAARRRSWRYRMLRPTPNGAPDSVADDPWVEPGLRDAMAALSPMQRRAVFLVAGLKLSQREAADLLGVRRASLRTHLDRGLARLRIELGVHEDV